MESHNRLRFGCIVFARRGIIFNVNGTVLGDSKHVRALPEHNMRAKCELAERAKLEAKKGARIHSFLRLWRGWMDGRTVGRTT